MRSPCQGSFASLDPLSSASRRGRPGSHLPDAQSVGDPPLVLRASWKHRADNLQGSQPREQAACASLRTFLAPPTTAIGPLQHGLVKAAILVGIEVMDRCRAEYLSNSKRRVTFVVKQAR